jgi:hypothetical protein
MVCALIKASGEKRTFELIFESWINQKIQNTLIVVIIKFDVRCICRLS